MHCRNKFAAESIEGSVASDDSFELVCRVAAPPDRSRQERIQRLWFLALTFARLAARVRIRSRLHLRLAISQVTKRTTTSKKSGHINHRDSKLLGLLLNWFKRNRQ